MSLISDNYNTTLTTERPESVELHHLQELRLSAISDEIIRLNFRSVLDAREVDKLLNRNTRSRRKHSSNLVPAWAVTGVDPLTEENILDGVQVKPDTPIVDKKGKIQKYLTATGESTAPLFLKTGIPDYWAEIINTKSIPVLITEGAKKAASGLSIGIPTISIPGVSTCRKNGRLHYYLELLAGFGRTFYLAFDSDILEKRPVQYALMALARDLSATGSKVMIINLPTDLKGMDDFIAAKGADEFKKLIDDAPTIEEWKKDLDDKRKNQEFDEEEEHRKSRIYRAYKIINKGWGDSLKLNLLKKQIELDEYELDLDLLKLFVAIEFDLDLSKEDAHAIILSIAKQNAYSPVVDYLDEIESRYPNPDLTILDNFAERYFGTSDPLHNTYIKKTLIAAVARARRPGVKSDDACILVGVQGSRKSTFWKELFGVDWFTDELTDSNEKDELMKLHQFWGLEIPEIEHIYKRKDVSTMKKFLSASTDVFRYPYDRQIKEHPRACILVGTSNEEELLSDPTGNRRYLIIPVTKTIPTDELIRERDLIWAAANHLFKMGHQWHLTQAEYAKQAEANKDYETSDPWEELVLGYVNGKDLSSTNDILSQALSLEAGKRDLIATKRVTAILKRNGWVQKRLLHSNGLRPRVWIKTISSGQVLKSSGSSGSQEGVQSTQPFTQQDFIADPLENDHVDHKEKHVLLDTSKNVIHEIHYDPLNLETFPEQETVTSVDVVVPSEPETLENTTVVPTKDEESTVVSEDTSKNVIHEIHYDPLNLETFPEQKSATSGDEVVDSKVDNPAIETVEPVKAEDTKYQCPPRCDYYRVFAEEYGVKPYEFTVDTHFGTVRVTAEPYCLIKSSGDSKIWVRFFFPDGTQQAKSYKGNANKKAMPRLVKETKNIEKWLGAREKEAAKWLSSAIKFKVRQVGDEDYIWIENCVLEKVAQALHPMFIFRTPDDRLITASFGEFEQT